jgi:hypothetical protein
MQHCWGATRRVFLLFLFIERFVARDIDFRSQLAHVVSRGCLSVNPTAPCRSVGSISSALAPRALDICDTAPSCIVKIQPCDSKTGFSIWSHIDANRLLVNESHSKNHSLETEFCLSPPGIVCRCYQSSDEEIWSVLELNSTDKRSNKTKLLIALGPNGLSQQCLAKDPRNDSHVVLDTCSKVDEAQHWILRDLQPPSTQPRSVLGH